MTPPFHTTKITAAAHRLLRLVAAITGERIYEVQERLVREELSRLAPDWAQAEEERTYGNAESRRGLQRRDESD